MNEQDRSIGLNALSFLCKGAKIEGLHFYGLKLLLSGNENNSNRIEGQIYINIENRFSVFKDMPQKTPLYDDLPKLDWIEASKLLCELRLTKIVKVSLGNESPHLYLTLETGEVLFIWGHHDQYESWQVGVYSISDLNEYWEVIACPGNELAVFGPDDIINL